MIKYKNCCGLQCLLANCDIRDSGGCYCVCRLKDAESTCIGLLEGKFYRKGDGIIYKPGIYVPLEDEEKKNITNELKTIRDKLKTYEVHECEGHE